MFLALALRQLGKVDEAAATLKQARELMRDPRYAKDEECQGFLREAELAFR